MPANNLKDFFDLVRKDPQKYTFGATTIGSASHLAIELLKRDAGLDTLVVAYKGTAPALTDLMSGQIQLLADPMLSSLPLAQGGKIKALGLTSLKRARRGARHPDRRGVRHEGLRVRVLVRICGAEEPAGRHLGQAAGRHRQGAGAARGEGAADTARLRADRLAPRAAVRANTSRDEMAKYEKIIKDAKIKVE